MITTAKMYVETANGSKIALVDVDTCIISVQTSSGKELARLQVSEFSMYKAIAKFHAELTELHGSFMTPDTVTAITADTFDVHTSHVHRCIKRFHDENMKSKRVKNDT